MGTPISEVSFYLYRTDTNEPVQESIPLALVSNDEQNSVYTFTTTFTATQNSSFGLDLNSFGIYVSAIDEAGNTDFINDTKLPEGEDINNFFTKVRVKEGAIPEGKKGQTGPLITPDGWRDHYAQKDIVVDFLIQDVNILETKTYRPAGIDTSRIEFYIDGEKQALQKEASEYFSNVITAATALGNDEVYKVNYLFSALEDGDYSIGVKVWDNDNHFSYFEEEVSIRTKAPSITLEMPEKVSNGYLREDNFLVKGTVVDGGPATVRIIVSKDGEASDPVDIYINEESGTYSKQYINQLDGNYKIEVYAFDIYGNASQTKVVEFILDSHAPIFKSVKFYPLDSEIPLKNDDVLEGGVQYRIVVEVI